MAFDVEMLPLGDADATIITYRQNRKEDIVILIDAGETEAHGKRVVRHIKTWTKGTIDLAVCTHPDADHIGGFPYVVDNLPIKEFWIHDPYQHIEAVRRLREGAYFGEASATIRSELTLVLESLGHAKSLLDKLKAKTEIWLREPFAGLQYTKAPLKVVGPTLPFYEKMLSKFRDVKQMLKEERVAASNLPSLTEALVEMDDATLVDRAKDPSKANASSTILLFEPDGKKLLFNADATVEALENATADYDLADLHWLSVPHHGSSCNISSELIRQLKPKIAFVSAEGSPLHPHPAVIRLLQQVGSVVYSTEKGAKRYIFGMGQRNGYTKAKPLAPPAK